MPQPCTVRLVHLATSARWCRIALRVLISPHFNTAPSDFGCPHRRMHKTAAPHSYSATYAGLARIQARLTNCTRSKDGQTSMTRLRILLHAASSQSRPPPPSFWTCPARLDAHSRLDLSPTTSETTAPAQRAIQSRRRYRTPKHRTHPRIDLRAGNRPISRTHRRPRRSTRRLKRATGADPIWAREWQATRRLGDRTSGCELSRAYLRGAVSGSRHFVVCEIGGSHIGRIEQSPRRRWEFEIARLRMWLGHLMRSVCRLCGAWFARTCARSLDLCFSMDDAASGLNGYVHEEMGPPLMYAPERHGSPGSHE